MNIDEKFKKKINNSVVRIIAEDININWNMPFIIDPPTKGQGTGFFIDKIGHILTCEHVVSKSKNIYIEIPSQGSEKYNCDLIWICPKFDIALIKVKDYKPLDYLNIGDSDKLKTGIEVQVVGYPMSLRNHKNNSNNIKFTTGIISGQQSGYIQTDSAINPGNSGGPLISQNKVIGINSLKLTGDLVDNIGFAIPINCYKVIKDNNSNIIYRPYFLFDYINTTKELLNLMTKNKISSGVIVSKIYNQSIFKNTNIKEGTIITDINKYKINNYGITNYKWIDSYISIKQIIDKFKNNETITITFYNNKIEKVKVKLTEFKYPIRYFYPTLEKIDYFIIGGIILMDLTTNHYFFNRNYNDTDIECYFNSDKNYLKNKIIVSFIIPNTNANRINNISKNNFISKINNIEVSTIKELFKIIETPIIINKKEYIKIEEINGSYLLLPIKETIKEDVILSQTYNYPLSNFHKKYLEK